MNIRDVRVGKNLVPINSMMRYELLAISSANDFGTVQSLINSLGSRKKLNKGCEFGIIYFAYRTSSNKKVIWYRIDLYMCALLTFYHRSNYVSGTGESRLLDLMFKARAIYSPSEDYPFQPFFIDELYQALIDGVLMTDNILINNSYTSDERDRYISLINDEAQRMLEDSKYTVFTMSPNSTLSSSSDYWETPGYLMAMVGLSASGKTTLALKLFSNHHFVIMDEPNTAMDIIAASVAMHNANLKSVETQVHKARNMADGLVLSLILSLITPGCTLDSVSLMSRKGVEAAKAHLTNEFPQWLSFLSAFLRQTGGRMVYLWNEYAADESLRDEIRARTMASTTSYIILRDFNSAEISSRVKLDLPNLTHNGDRTIKQFNPGSILTTKGSNPQSDSISFKPAGYGNPSSWSNPMSKYAIDRPVDQSFIDDTINLEADKHQLSLDNATDLSKIFSI
jgi:adenylate kinase family enzyme